MNITVIRNAAQAFAHLEKIAGTSSKLEKEALVKAGLDQALFQKIVVAALDPFKTYGIGIWPARAAGLAEGANTLDEPTWWEVIDKLATRELSGTAAREAVQRAVNFLSPESAELFKRIVLKDLRAGFSESTVNKAKKGTLPSFPYMRCSLPADSDMTKPDFWDEGAISQEKADGRFANVNHDETGAVWITSRQGTPMPLHNLERLVTAVKHTLNPGTQSHGELLVYQDGVVLPREKGNGVISHLDSGGQLEDGQELVFFAWDQIPLSAVVPKGKYELGYKQRLAGLAHQIAHRSVSYSTMYSVPNLVRLVPTRLVKTYAEALQHYRELLALGKEGTIVKHPKAIWKDGTSKSQIKLKLKVPVELKVVGYNEGTGKNVGSLGSLQCESECGKLRVDVSGRTDAMRADWWANREGRLGSIIVADANGVMSPSKEGGLYSLFLPIFVEGPRTDKSVADTLEEIEAQFAAAVAA